MKQLVLKDLLQTDNEALLVNTLDLIWKKVDSTRNPNAVHICMEFYELGGHGILLNVMTKYPNSEAIQYHCMGVVCNTIFCNKDLDIAFAMVDGMQAVLAAMEKFPNVPLIQEVGIVTLLNMTSRNDSNAKALVQNWNGLPIILGAMNRFSDHETLTHRGCSLLCSLCRLIDLRTSIFDDTAALTTLATARDTHKQNQEILQYVVEVLDYFAAYSRGS